MGNIDILGKGIAFPLEVDSGALKTLEGLDLIRSSIANILAWDYGTFYFKTDFGVGLSSFIEKPLDEVTLSLLRLRITQSLQKWEKRIEVLGVTPFIRDMGVLEVSIKYKIIKTNTIDSFVIPFINTIRY